MLLERKWNREGVRSTLLFHLYTLPPAGGAAGERKSGGGDGQADLLGIHPAGEFLQLRGDQVGEHRGSQPGGVGVHQEEQGSVRPWTVS